MYLYSNYIQLISNDYTYRFQTPQNIRPLRENQVIFPDGAKYFWVAPCFKKGHIFLFWQF